MRVPEGGEHGTHEEHSRNVADEICEHEHGSADGKKLRSDGAFHTGLEEVDEIGDGAGIFESLHNDEKRSEKKQELPADAAIDVFGFDATDDENERGYGGSGERE